ncbi:hypothetical protein N0V90_010592 [Kalmusia sp. IMI 367209]|nr:hypothetical protein N0V90_010592 [Kalmusia sp. IMI 367209]
MVRRSAGFVAKRPHKKSREKSISSLTTPSDELIDFNEPLQTPLWLMPAVYTSAGQLNSTELKYLHHYKTSVWSVMSLQKSDIITFINRDWVPQASISSEHMLYSILSISALHHASHLPQGTSDGNTLSLLYRQRAFASYNKALANITSENYESLLITSMWMMVMASPPTLPCSDDACLDWASSFFGMMQGLRILASLKWASGIEKLTMYPLLRRALRELPPPPMLTPLPDWFYYPKGDEWRHPNPPGDDYTETPPITTDFARRSPTPPATPPNSTPQSAGVHIDTSKLPFRPQKLMSASDSPHAPPSWKAKKPTWELPAAAFLPPPLMSLLQRLVDPLQTGPLDLHRPVLIPVLHALSPIFLSLYYYRLSTDLHVRIFVFPTFLTAEFLGLVKSREPRALVMAGWYFALLSLLPQLNKWFSPEVIVRVLQSVSNVVMRSCDGALMDAMEGAYRIVKTEMRLGKEAAARTIFQAWDGVNWEEGPRREEQWRVEQQRQVEEVDCNS